MTALRLANRLLSLLSASALLMCGALAAADAVAVEALMAVYEAGRGYVYNTNGDRGEALFLALNRALVGAMAALAAREVAE